MYFITFSIFEQHSVWPYRYRFFLIDTRNIYTFYYLIHVSYLKQIYRVPLLYSIIFYTHDEF